MAELQEDIRTIREWIQQRILRGEWPEGTRIDEEALRKESGKTVRVIRGALQELTQIGLLSRKQRIGTVVALKQASSSPPLRITRVGVLTSLEEPGLAENKFFQLILRGIQDSLPAKTELIIHSNKGQTDSEIHELPPVQAEELKAQVSGLIAIESYNLHGLNQLMSLDLPVVSIDYWPPGALFDGVCVNHEGAGYSTTEHLLSLGHRNIAYLGEAPNYRSSDPTWQSRLSGYLRAMAEKSGSMSRNFILDSRRETQRIPQILPDFHRNMAPSAYVLCSCSLFSATLKTLRDMGLNCPKDVSLACADGIESVINGVRIARSQVVYEELGRTAVRLLNARVNNRTMPPVQSLLNPVFVPGPSAVGLSK